MRKQILVVFTLVVGLTVPLSSCSSDVVKDIPSSGTVVGTTILPGSTESIPIITKRADIRLPLVSLDLTADDEATIHDGYDVLMRRCTARFGVDSTYPHLPSERAAAYDVTTRYGLADLATAQSVGYGVYSPSTENSRDEYKANDWKPSLREYQVSYGANPDGSDLAQVPVDADGHRLPEKGCLRRPGSLSGADVLDRQLIGRLMAEGYASSLADQRTLDVEAAWSECMRHKGFKFATRLDAIRSFDFKKPPSDEQVRTATADVSCKFETNYLGVWTFVESTYQQRVIDAHEPEIREFRRIAEAMLDNARRLVAEG